MDRKRTLKEKCTIGVSIFLCAVVFAVFGVLIGGFFTIGTGNYVYLLVGTALFGAVGGLFGFVVSTGEANLFHSDYGDPEWPWRLFRKEARNKFLKGLMGLGRRILIAIFHFDIGGAPGALVGILVGHFIGETTICVLFFSLIGGYLGISIVKKRKYIFIMAFCFTVIGSLIGAGIGGMLMAMRNDGDYDTLRFSISFFAVLLGFFGGLGACIEDKMPARTFVDEDYRPGYHSWD